MPRAVVDLTLNAPGSAVPERVGVESSVGPAGAVTAGAGGVVSTVQVRLAGVAIGVVGEVDRAHLEGVVSLARTGVRLGLRIRARHERPGIELGSKRA